ncbi:THAP domain-containing protein 1-like [Coccinella septempunctata]|uniref:THAP domain-containing protein 1-like n=1 Tax=Coccinella septempunctata TaxID=41139 RepID=UPI001D07ABB4|nr:THAP domain-containing protein 1-like [Coccinella septempunctata]
MSRTKMSQSFHRFPFKLPDILELWITAVGRENWYPSKYSRICEDYLHNPSYTRKILKLDAVPSVFNNIPRHSRIMEYLQFHHSSYTTHCVMCIRTGRTFRPIL